MHAVCDTLSHLQGSLHYYYYMIQTDIGRERTSERERIDQERCLQSKNTTHCLGCVPSAFPILSLQIIPVDISYKQTKRTHSKTKRILENKTIFPINLLILCTQCFVWTFICLSPLATSLDIMSNSIFTMKSVPANKFGNLFAFVSSFCLCF